MRGNVIEVYKYLNGIYKVNSADILPRHRSVEPATRGHSLKLEKCDYKSRIRANFFGYRVCVQCVELFARGHCNCQLGELSQRKTR